MHESIFVDQSAEKRSFQNWLFHPFRYVAGWSALAIGLLAIAASALVCHAASLHFDGVLEAHFYKPAPMWLFFAEGVSAWLSMALVLHILGALLAPAPYRFIDMLSTQAMARWPYFFVALVSIPGGVRRAVDHLIERATEQPDVTQISAGDVTVGIIALLVTVAAAVWMVTLMYRAYSVSTGIRQTRRRILSFIVGLLFASVISKVAFIVIAVHAGLLPRATQP